jgi:predicted nucleotidyltransferase
MVALKQIKSLARAIADQFQPEKIILFGSHAKGRPTRHSDVDLLVLMRGTEVHDQALLIRQAFDFGFPVDLLVRSPAEMKRRISWGDQFLQEIEQNGIVLYEAPHRRMGAKGRGRFRHSPARSSRAKVA